MSLKTVSEATTQTMKANCALCILLRVEEERERLIIEAYVHGMWREQSEREQIANSKTTHLCREHEHIVREIHGGTAEQP